MQPVGWKPVTGAELAKLLHPPIDFEATTEIRIGDRPPAYDDDPGETGAVFAEAGDELTITSLGNAVARVYNEERACSAVFQLSQLDGKVELRDRDVPDPDA